MNKNKALKKESLKLHFEDIMKDKKTRKVFERLTKK